MLVLTRRVGETILVGDLIEIRLVDVYENAVRLAIRLLKTNTPLLTVTLGIDHAIMIGDQIEIVSVLPRGDHSRIGITAPPEVPIVRGK